MSFSFRFVLVLPLVLACACRAAFVDGEPANRPSASFDRIHRDFAEYYGLFEAKGIDWDATYATYRPRVHDDMTDAELYDVVVDMLFTLSDKHVTLYPATSPDLPNASIDLVDGAFPAPPYDASVVETRYLARHVRLHPNVTVGVFDDGCGYLAIESFDGDVDAYDGVLDRALRELATAPGVVIDVRGNAGGFDPLAQAVAGRFAAERHLYMTVRKRNGPAYDAFGEPVAWYVEPSARVRYLGPVVVLTSYATQSAAETFLLAMRELPNVVHVGETTAGAFSDAILRETYNGWAYTISVGDYRAADGRSYEGVGLVPEVFATSSYEGLAVGTDHALEVALAVLEASATP